MLRFFSSAAFVISMFAFTVSGLAQDGNPFGPVSSQDPFAPSGSPAQIKQRRPEPNVDLSKLTTDQQLAHFKAQNAKLKEQLAKSAAIHQKNVKAIVNRLKQTESIRAGLLKRLNQIEKSELDDKARREYGQKAYFDLLTGLLSSEGTASQLAAMTNIRDLYNKAAKQDIEFYPINDTIVQQLDKLVDSADEEIQKQAVDTILTIQPVLGIKRGYQRAHTGFWEPMPIGSKDSLRIRRTLGGPSDFDYDETPLWEVVEHISETYQFNVFIDDSVKLDTPLSMNSRGQTLATGLEMIADNFGLVVAIKDNSVKFVPKGSPDSFATLTYNVRGLLSDNVSIGKLMEISTGQLNSDSKIWVVGKHQLVAKAPEMDQRKISMLLGSLSKND